MILDRAIVNGHGGQVDEGTIEFRQNNSKAFVNCPYHVLERKISDDLSNYLRRWATMTGVTSYEDELTSKLEDEINETVETSCPIG